MKKIIVSIFIFFIFVNVASVVDAGDDRFSVPRLAYLEPGNQTVVDLTGKDSLTFSWKGQPVPSGGRNSFRFRLYKGFGYEVVASEQVDPRTFLINIPSDKMEDGMTYSWHVQQRDDRSMIWSLFDTWSFKVVKKK